MEAESPISPLLPDKMPEVLGDMESKYLATRSFHTPAPIGAGLENLGNTCFLNSVLQCVTHTAPLIQSLGALLHAHPCYGGRGNSTSDEAKFCSLCALKELVEICVRETGTVKPYAFVDNLSNISSSFSRYQQEDAHEFLHCLLDKLDSDTSCLDAENSDGTSLQKNSIIKDVFGGRLRSQIQCCCCGHCSNTYEPQLGISLEIEDAESLEDALESFTKVEKIEDPEIKFTCEECKAHVSVHKQLMLDQAPSVVSLHLKRFRSNGYFTDKIDKFVKYPAILDLGPYHSSPEVEANLKYELYAGVIHQGMSSLFGHYYCFIRPSPDLWYIMDDERVYEVTENNALKQSAYLLFYVKQGTPWFCSLLGEKTMSNYLNTGTLSPVSVVDHVEAQLNSSSDSDDYRASPIDSSRGDEILNLCNAPSVTDSTVVERENISSSSVARYDASQCGSEGSQAEEAVCNQAEEALSYQAEDPESSCTATPICRPSSSTNCEMSAAERSSSAFTGATKSAATAPLCEGNLTCSAVNGSKSITPRTPTQPSKDMFCDETWEVDDKKTPKEPMNTRLVKSAGKPNFREMAALGCLRSMPRSRRIGLEKLVFPGRSPPSAEHQRKRKLRVDGESSPCRSSSAMRAYISPLSPSILQQLVSQDDSHLVLAINPNPREKSS